jgi:hypothetical protein
VVEETPVPACVECGSPLEPDQTYCLVCGTPTPRAPRLHRARGPGWLVLALVVLGIGAGALAWAIAADDDGTAVVTTTPTVTDVTTAPTDTVDTGTVGTLPSDTTGSISVPTEGTESVDTGFVTVTSGTDTVPTDTGGLPTDTSGIPPGTTDTPPTDTSPTDTGTETFPTETEEDVVSDWPVGTSGWTAVISSVGDPQEAADTRDQAVSEGVGAKILLSDDHPGLTPGLYVVYVGVFGERAAAIAQATRLRDRYPGAYARFISA